MAQADVSVQFGAELRDAFKPVNSWVSNGIGWLDEIQQFYRERSAIEKEYAAKLTALCRKYYDRKAKKSSSLSVGDTPAMTPGSLESASLTTWTTQLSSLETEAAEREQFGNDLVFRVAEPLKQAAAKFDEMRKSHVEYAGKLEKERDSSYGELKKIKGKYDGICQEVENRRKKLDSSFDYGKQKAQNAYHHQVLEMNNVKNTYLIAVNVTNKLKEKYYYEYVPELLDSMQDLNETRIHQLNSIWILAAQLEKSLLAKSDEQVTHVLSEIPRNEPKLDSVMFVRHNITNWQEPQNIQFEPSPVWHDDAAMITDEAAKVFLRNLLTKSKGQMRDKKIESGKRRREVEGIKRIRQAVREGKDKRDEVEIVRGIFAMQDELHLLDRKQMTAEVETATVTSVVGDLSLGAVNHNFRAQTFKIPTNCDLCGERIWGLSAKGFDCKDCGYTCHSKCEMKVPAECPGELSKEDKKKIKVERQERASTGPAFDSTTTPPTNGAAELPTLTRQNTMNSLSSGYSANASSVARSSSALPTVPDDDVPAELPAAPSPAPQPAATGRRRVVAPPPAQYINPPSTSNGGGNVQQGKMLYSYQATSEDEVTVEEDQDVIVVEPDDGSGWMRVRSGSSTGLVPASYVESLPDPTTPTAPSATIPDRPGSVYSSSSASVSGSAAGKRRGPAVAPKRGAKKLQYAVALYDYEARSELEWSMKEGDRFVLVNRDSGNGWADVEKGGVTRSVPANYIEEA